MSLASAASAAALLAEDDPVKKKKKKRASISADGECGCCVQPSLATLRELTP
jgi:hypothetical protein